jgi:hypothetical protein
MMVHSYFSQKIQCSELLSHVLVAFLFSYQQTDCMQLPLQS